MPIGWSKLTFCPNEEAVAMLRRSWAWLIPAPWKPLLFSVLGDVFLEREPEGVFWLNTGTGEITLVASDTEEFQTALGTEIASNWFMPDLVSRLHQAGKIPGPSECYTYAVFPIFSEGKYEIAKFGVVPAREHFGLSGDLHARISGLPDGQEVRIVVGPDPGRLH
jgi:hypothetical protein